MAFKPNSFFGSLEQAVQYSDTLQKQVEQTLIKYNLPFTGIGSDYKGPDFRACMNGPDNFIVEVASPSLFSAYASKFECNGSVMKDVIDGKHLPHLGLYRMTDEEKQELEELEKSLSRWLKQQKLEKFKRLPSHIRQDIVDESIVNELSREHTSTDITKFSDHKRLKQLRDKQHPDSNRWAYGLQPESEPGFVFRYAPIIEKFTSEELMEAHAQASIDEELAD